MLLRLVTGYRRGGARLLPGDLLDAGAAEAEFLVGEGIAVPVTDRELQGTERR